MLQWKSNKYYIFWECVCSFFYSASNALAPYYIVICGLSVCLYHIFHIISYTTLLSEERYWT